MARPRKGEEKSRPHHLGVRVSDEVRDGLKALAKARGVPVSDLAHDALEAYLTAQKRRKAA
jgi:predicted transcriptional regulator